MKKSATLFLAGVLCLGLTGCGSSSSSDSSKADEKEGASASEETAAETKEDEKKEEEPKEEVKEEAAWEVGEATAVTYPDSIGSTWIQIICPVKNTGTKTLYLSSGTMDLEDKDGHLVDSKNLISVFPEVLQPGETAYYYEETILDDGMPTDLNVLPHVKVKEAKVDCIRYEISDVAIADEEYGGVKITGRVENTTDESESMVQIVALLYDADNNLLALPFTYLTDELAAGDKMGFSMSTFSAPDSVTAGAVDHYEIYAYPQQFQF